MDVGIIGANSRAVCFSARRLGLRTFLIDYFDDTDVKSDFHYPLQKNPLMPDFSEEYSIELLIDHAIENLSGKVDSVLVTSEAGCNPASIEKLERHFKVLGNSSHQVRYAKDWGNLKKSLEKIDIGYPETFRVRSFDELVKCAESMSYPLVVKSMTDPHIAPHLIRSAADLDHYKEYHFDSILLVQEYISGIPVSCSLLCSSKRAHAVSVNRQLIGLSFLGCSELTYCGNIVPLSSESDRVIAERSERLCTLLRLSGSNGVDYVLTPKGPYFMEVNTRFQDTLECVEKAYGINLVEKHLEALEGRLPEYNTPPKGFYGKAVLYATKDFTLRGFPRKERLGDVPPFGSKIRLGEPICSIYADSMTQSSVLDSIKARAAEIKNINGLDL